MVCLLSTLKVVYPDNLEEQLQQSVKDFVQYWANRNSEQVVIPPSIHQYIQSTGQDMMVFLKDYVGEMEAVPRRSLPREISNEYVLRLINQ